MIDSSNTPLVFFSTFISKLLFICIPLYLLSGCVGNKQSLIYDTVSLGLSSPSKLIDEAPLNPNYRYLKVEANGQPALLALGYVDQKKQSKHDVWFSAFKEVVEIKDGRLGNTEGLEVNWTEVSLIDAPPLREALALNLDAGDKAKQKLAKLRYMRIRTVMPGYHVNIRETVVMEALNKTPSDAPKQLKDPIANENIRWVQETVLVPPNLLNPSIKPLRAIYAINVKTNETVFGKQYLTPDFFVSWLTWPYSAPSKDQQSTK